MNPAELFSRVRSEEDLSQPRRWNGNDRSQRNHNGAVPLSEDPLEIILRWKKSPEHPARPVGCFRLNLRALLEAGYIRADNKLGHVRLRFFHDHDGSIYIEVRPGRPRLLIGKVE